MRSPHCSSGFTLTRKPKSRSLLVREKKAVLMVPGKENLFPFLTKLPFPALQAVPGPCFWGLPASAAGAPPFVVTATLTDVTTCQEGKPVSQTHCHRPCHPSQASQDATSTQGDACPQLFPLPNGLSCLSPTCPFPSKSSLLRRVNFKSKCRNNFEMEYYCTQSQSRSLRYLEHQFAPC